MYLKDLLKKIPLRGSFENVLFWGVLFFCFIAAIASTVFTAIENLGALAVIYTAFITLYFVILGVIAYSIRKTEACYTALCFALNTLILPPMFFICGGFTCGMPFYCMTSILISSLIKNFRSRVIMNIYSLILYITIFVLDWFFPNWSPDLEQPDMLIDQVVSFIFMAVLIFAIVSYLLKAYRRETTQKDKLITELNYMSTHDPLTGLYNRRYFIESIREKVLANPKSFYMLMFDIDFFKRVNDTYGHLFGDQVLNKIGTLANEFCSFDGEMAVRYGGEEFILLLREESYDRAFVKAEHFRNNVAAIDFEEHPEVHIHISGGFIDCADPEFTNYDKMLSTVDAKLYLAKTNGRDQIAGKK